MIFLAYGGLVILMVFLSTKLGFYVDQIDKKSNLSSAFIGGVMLAAVTSLPELFTSISSVLLVQKPALVLGNVLGSNLFNSAVLGLVFVLYLNGMSKSTLTKSHITTVRSTIIVYLCLLIPIIFKKSFDVFTISIISIIIIVLYIFTIRSMSSDENMSEEDDNPCKLTLKQIIFRFVLASIALVATSITLTYVSDQLSVVIGLGTTSAGAFLLGIVTSLPELISCFVLAKVANFNAVTGNILGSNLFNFAILFVSDILCMSKQLYIFDTQGVLLVVLGAISAVTFIFLLTAHNNKTDNRVRPLYAILSVVPLICYGIFVFLGV